MKHFLKTFLILTLTLVMVATSLIIVTAEETTAADGETVIIVSADGSDAPRAYELVWKYKYDMGHYWKRRWNMTLGGWYDPAWILVR